MKRPAEPLHKPAPIRKERSIQFAEIPPGQVPEAADFLGGLERLEIRPRSEQLTIDVTYDLHDHSLEELESALEDKGFHLDNTLLSKLTRALIHYVEETQLHNLGAPEKRLKRSSQEAYVKAWEHRPHGDHDETPPEWREYK